MESASQLSISLIAGGLAGASETFVTYPAEFVKTRRQLETSGSGKQSANSFGILKSTIRETGIRGVYAGCQTLAISNALKSGVRFFSFETAKRKMSPYFSAGSPKTESATPNPWLNLSAGLCAGAAESVLVVTPGEALKTRVIDDAASRGHLGRLSMSQLVTYTIRRDGILSLWRGLAPVLCKQGTNSAVRFTTFGVIRDKLGDAWPGTMNGTMATMLAGAGSGVVTVYASMPFDNVKTRMQSFDNHGRHMVSVAANMLAREGVLVFWKATMPRLVRLTLSSSITFIVYDYSLKLFDLLTPRRTDSKVSAEV
ncbi:mitochondrial carrier [Polyplosphaeria fusca]|uniref:Mitochondrial carrier n=1 Tax=Polyplosphaeria fusca TaxID=682080 RepID=A0A9P4UW89_9PLEO|nr:mitochondrial carrier [Polyplosphaeria fusca]